MPLRDFNTAGVKGVKALGINVPTSILLRAAEVTDFEMIDDAFKALLQSSHPNPVVEAKIVDLREKFRDAFTGWLEIEEAA